MNKVPARPKINKLTTKTDNPNSERNDTQNRLSLSNSYYIKVPYCILAKGSPHEGGNMINKVLATISYISGLFDCKSIVKEVVWRKTKIRGGAY